MKGSAKGRPTCPYNMQAYRETVEYVRANSMETHSIQDLHLRFRTRVAQLEPCGLEEEELAELTWKLKHSGITTWHTNQD